MAEIEEAASQNIPSESESQIERAVLRLRELILKGEFEAGERVSEAPLTTMRPMASIATPEGSS